MLAVVEDDQGLLVGHVLRHRLDYPLRRAVMEPQHPRDLLREQRWVPQTYEIGPPDPIREPATRLLGGAKRKAGFPDPGGPRESDHPR